MNNEYKGYRLQIDMENGGEIVCSELDMRAATIAEMKTLINQKLKSEKKEKAPECPALKVGRNAEFVRVKITSVASPGEAWISNDGRRTKNSTRDLLADTPENESALNALAEKIDAKLNELNALRDSIYDLPKPDILREPAK